MNTPPAPRKSPQPPPPPAGFTTHVPSLPNTFPIPPDHPEPLPAGPGTAAKSIFIIILVLIAVGVWREWRGSSSALASWGRDWEKSIDQAQTTKKPMLILFSADWCPACNQLESTVLSRSDVTKNLEDDFVLVKVDLTDRSGPGANVAREFGVRAIPTMIIVTPDGKRSDPLTGSVSAERLEQWTSSRKSGKAR